MPLIGGRNDYEVTAGEEKEAEKEEIIGQEKEELEPEMPSKVLIDYERPGIKVTEFSINKTTCLSESNGIIGPTILPEAKILCKITIEGKNKTVKNLNPS